MEVVAGTALKFLKKNHLSIEFSTTFVLLHKIHDNPFWPLSLQLCRSAKMDAVVESVRTCPA